ncbi:MAG: NTP transferase domain-containing protein [Pyrinomonadaceae bacterium]|nr:NTP transferase domain-containing protein [Pyrinomonadaceae bacterium]
MFASELQQFLSAALPEPSDDSAEGGRAGLEPDLPEYLFAGNASGRLLSARALRLLLSQVYGVNDEAVRKQLLRLNSLCSVFLELYGDGSVNLLRAPARINIIGEHVDYVSYLPTASLTFGSREHDMLMLYRAAETEQVRGASTFADYHPFDFALSDGPAPSCREDHENEWLTYLYDAPPPIPHWGNYVKGSCYLARAKYGDRVARSYNFLVDSNIPPSGGASSSSALVVLAGAAIREANRISFNPHELALDSAKAEWYVGTRGGAMDHLTICLAERAHAVGTSYREGSARTVPLVEEQLRWATFFSHPADKGREIMLEYNERAAIARVLIPAVVEGWKLAHPEPYAAWGRAIESLASVSATALVEIESLINQLPETITLAQAEQVYPDAYRQCELAFPVLVSERRDHPLRLRACALHHLGEVRRVSTAKQLLHDTSFRDEVGGRERGAQSLARSLGQLINESHKSLRDLYAVSTPDVESLIEILLSDPSVYGARLMGGGFGGNVLALTSEENVPALVARVQAEFYEPRGRDGLREGAVMVSTPGEGLSRLDLEIIWREVIEWFNSTGQEAAHNRMQIASILDSVAASVGSGEVWPVIVAAGKGSRARATGLDAPKPLAVVAGVPSILRVLRSVRAATNNSRAAVVIVSPETEPGVRRALADEDVVFVVQPEPMGTGDAVLHAYERMKDFRGRALIIWGTQPAIHARTILRALKLAALFDEYEMIVPTALKERPYAPVVRDTAGRVSGARETHTDNAPAPDFGETNNGFFVLDSQAMFGALTGLHQRHWIESAQRYDRPGGELGFPNELINYFAGREPGVLACPFVEPREGQGIKTLEDVARCERFISELRSEES